MPKLAHLISFFFCSLCLISCSRSDVSLPGYIEGEYTYVSSGVAGALTQLFVQRGQVIQKGVPLYVLDPEPEASDVAASTANREDLKAQVLFAKAQLDRETALYKTHFAAKADLDQAQQIYSSRTQEMDANTATLNHSLWALNQKTMNAPVDGVVFDTFYRVGERVDLNHPVLAILNPSNIEVLFYVPETLLSHIKLGEEITFTCDSCEQVTHAKISYVSPEAEFTPPVIYSKDSRDKLVYLIRASMPADIAIQFHPGQPIDVSLPL
jgi:HlyD family secretion protein